MITEALRTHLGTEVDGETGAETEQLAPLERVADAFSLLDYRTRSRAVPERLARRGPHLAVSDGSDTLLIPLEAKITHLGRGTGAEVRVEDQRVSRSHAIIVRYDRGARVLDNRSANGTFLNGRRVVATNLQSGDVICVGPVVLQYFEVP